MKDMQDQNFLDDFYIKEKGRMTEIPEDLKRSLIMSEVIEDEDPYLDESVYANFEEKEDEQLEDTNDGES